MENKEMPQKLEEASASEQGNAEIDKRVNEEDILKWEKSSSGDNSKRLTLSRMMKLKKTNEKFKEDVRPSTSQFTATLSAKQSITGAFKKLVPNWVQKKSSKTTLKSTVTPLSKIDLQ